MTRRFQLLVRGGTLVSEERVWRGDLGIRGGRIDALLQPGDKVSGEEVIDASGLHVFPGFFDPHTHVCDEGQSDWDDYATATAAAAAGGVTALGDMPLNDPPTTTAERFAHRREVAAAQARVDFGLWAGMVPGNSSELEAMHAAGAKAFKAFMCRTAGYEHCPPADLLAGMRVAARLGALVGVHAEDDTLIELISGDLRGAGRRDPQAHAAAHPAASSLVAIHTAIALAALAGCRLHVLHVDVAAAGQALREAKAAGLPVSAEGAIAFLTLDEEDYWRLGPYARFSPPLRSRQNQDGLWELLREGTLSFVISDHSPYSAEVKEPGWRDIWGVPDGAPTLQLCYQLLLSEGVHKRGFSLPHFCALSSSNAARLFGCYPRKGSLQPGADADLALLDLEAGWIVRADDLIGKHRWTPYEGKELRGRVISTVRRGELVYDRGELLAQPGSGRAW